LPFYFKEREAPLSSSSFPTESFYSKEGAVEAMPALLFQRREPMLRYVLATAVFSLFALAFPAGGVSPACADDTVFRCGAESVSIGDSRYSVQKICGKPSRSESVGKTSKEKKQKQPKGSRSTSSSGKVQKWYYDRGYGDFVYVLTFEKDVLKKIEKSGRGR
jgi:hypothetical protein